MKKVIIFHGTNGNPNKYWYQWLAQHLRDRGYDAQVPSYPDINRTPISDFLPEVLNNHTFDKDTVLVGHSAGGPLILSILEHINVTVIQAILVAGYSTLIEGETQLDPVLRDKYDWPKIKRTVSDIYFINSINDPWGCDEKQGRILFNRLGGTLIIRDEGHFGTNTFNQPYPTFELLNKLIP